MLVVILQLHNQVTNTHAIRLEVSIIYFKYGIVVIYLYRNFLLQSCITVTACILFNVEMMSDMKVTQFVDINVLSWIVSDLCCIYWTACHCTIIGDHHLLDSVRSHH
jgi:hypothetical protein